MTKWVVKEHEGYTNKVIKTWEFETEPEALEHFQRCIDWNKVAGVGGKWKHYFSFPQEVKT